MAVKRRIAVAGVVLLSACGGSGSPKATSTTHALTGTLTVYSLGDFPQLPNFPTECVGTGGYGDLQEGASVTVRNQSNTIIATGGLDKGLRIDDDHCAFDFSIAAVPAASFYTVEVSHRGAVSYSAKELAEYSWHVDSTLGS